MLHRFAPRLKGALAAGGALMLAGCGAVGAASLGWSAESPSAVRWRGAEGALPGYAQVSRMSTGPFAPAFAVLSPREPVEGESPRGGGLFDVLSAMVAQPPFGLAPQAAPTATLVRALDTTS